MTAQLVPVTAGEEGQPLGFFVEAMAAIGNQNVVLRAAFAYVSLAGAERFLELMGALPTWDDLPKQILLGVHHAISEPAALDRLRSLPETEVRLFVPGYRLRLEAFGGSPVFHPKVLALAATDGRALHVIQAGSMNMSAAALGRRPRNYEFGVAVRSEGDDDLDPEIAFSNWWSGLWATSRRVDRRLIRRYAKLRHKVLDANPLLRVTTDVPAGIADAEFFFCEVGAGSGPPGRRHQIEFSGALVPFFGRVELARRDIILRRGKDEWTGRPLSYKRTTYGVDIWRLGMPTQTSGGPPIAERAIRFRRTENPEVFEFEVKDTNSEDFDNWVKSANLRGHLSATGGQRARRFGFY